ncbi:hypothetical protein CsatB_011164 [Cannabis sativa]
MFHLNLFHLIWCFLRFHLNWFHLIWIRFHFSWAGLRDSNRCTCRVSFCGTCIKLISIFTRKIIFLKNHISTNESFETSFPFHPQSIALYTLGVTQKHTF